MMYLVLCLYSGQYGTFPKSVKKMYDVIYITKKGKVVSKVNGQYKQCRQCRQCGQYGQFS